MLLPRRSERSATSAAEEPPGLDRRGQSDSHLLRRHSIPGCAPRVSHRGEALARGSAERPFRRLVTHNGPRLFFWWKSLLGDDREIGNQVQSEQGDFPVSADRSIFLLTAAARS